MFNQIIEGCRKQRRDSQKELYKLFYAYGMSIALRYADSRESAVSILNDSFLKVFDNMKGYDSSRPFKPWLRTIIVNTAINHFHKQKKHLNRMDTDLDVDEIGSEEEILSGISFREIIDLVQELSPAYRTVFNLYVVEGYKHHEIAKMLGISIGTSKSNLSKAKRNLQAKLEENLTRVKRHERQ